MEGMILAFPSNVFSSCPLTVRRRKFSMDVLRFSRFGATLGPASSALSMRSLAVNLRPRSELLWRSEPKITNARSLRLNGACRAGSADRDLPDSSIPMSPASLDSQGPQGKCFSLQNIRLESSLLVCRSVLAHLYVPRVVLQDLFAHLAKNCGRVLLLALMFSTLSFCSGRSDLRHALAAPSTTSIDSRRKAAVERNGEFDREAEEEEELVSERERWRRDLERTLRKALFIEDGSSDAPKREESESQHLQKVLEEISANLRVVQVDSQKETEAYLKVLNRLDDLIGKQVDRVIDDYFTAQARLIRLDKDAGESEREEKARMLREKAEAVVQCRQRLSATKEALKKISKRLKQVTWTRQAAAEQDRKSGVSQKIARDLERAKAIKRERTLLPLAAKVEPVEVEPPQPILQRIEQEQIISLKLMDLLKRLVIAMEENRAGKQDPELEKRMSEVRDLILDDSRWESADAKAAYLLDLSGVQKELSPEEKEKILSARDRVLNHTWYDEKSKRWEMKSLASLYAVEKNVAGRARFRHDWGALYLTLKGDDREYYVNTKELAEVYEDYGGLRTLYYKLIGEGVPTSVEKMRIPLREWSIERLVLLPFRIIGWLLEDFWNSSFVVAVRPWCYKNMMETFEELMIRFGFPIIQRIAPQKARVAFGFELPEGAEAAEPTDIMIWQQEAQRHVDARYAEGSGSPVWWISLPVRCYAVGLPLFFVLRLVLRIVASPFRPKPLEMTEVQKKENLQKDLEKEQAPLTKKQTIDPIKTVFDKMKRVRRPEVSLKDFAGIDTIKEEVNEIISFLKNPKLFREMGARPPRGVLIVGESGTGKTTLALAIAAEARVPMVELQGAELEGGAWVGQGASNVRELFKTARELAPLIIFMDDFDHFAGIRGATSDTRKQDHETLINQLLVELDGFETQEGVVLVATTSRPYAIDEALRRPGRMDRTIQLPTPNKREREQILRQAAYSSMDTHLIDYVDWSKVAEKTAGLTPAHLKCVPEGLEGSAVSNKIADDEELYFIFTWLAGIEKISPRWIKESKWVKRSSDSLIDWLGLRVTKRDMESAVETLDVYGEAKPGLELFDPPYVWTRKFKYPHAVWAVGKGLLALLLPDFDYVEMIWLDPTSWDGIGFAKLTKRFEGGYEETGTMTRSYCEKELVSCFGSIVASQLLLDFGEANSLCKVDINRAKEIATRMVMQYGWASDDSPMIYITDNAQCSLSMGDRHEMEVADKINKLFYKACDKALHMLQQNRPVLEAMLEQLLKFDALSNKAMQRIMDEMGVVYEDAPFTLEISTQVEIVGASTNGTGRFTSKGTMSMLNMYPVR